MLSDVDVANVKGFMETEKEELREVNGQRSNLPQQGYSLINDR